MSDPKTLEEAKEPEQDKKNLIENNRSCKIPEKVSKLNSVKFVNKEKIQNPKNELNKHRNISYSFLNDIYVGYD